MDLEKVNRLPSPTWRYLKTNDSDLPFRKAERPAKAVWSDTTYMTEGAVLPARFEGASAAWKEAAASGECRTVRIPAGTRAMLRAEIAMDEAAPDFAGTYVFHVEKGAELRLVWQWKGGGEDGVCAVAAAYELEDGAVLHVSSAEEGLGGKLLCMQRLIETGEGAQAEFVSADLGGRTVITHSRGYLEGKKSSLHEYGVYTAGGRQHLDLFYHIDHLGEETDSDVEVKGALAGEAKKVFRSTIDFKRGCSGATGNEGDYAIQLDPKTKNISLPLLLCTEDNVAGNHASSAGQIDEQTLYYLMSRGLTKEEARRIVVESLLRPLIDRLDESLRDGVLAGVRARLDAEGGEA